jgi:tetratricopeptide (TPR) repeat protein
LAHLFNLYRASNPAPGLRASNMGLLHSVIGSFQRRTTSLTLFAGISFVFAPCLSAAQSTQNARSQVQQLYQDAKAAEAEHNLPAAIADYQKILKIAPGLASVYNNLGVVYYEDQNLPMAAAVLRKGLQLDPNMVTAYTLLGSVEFSMGNYEKARPVLETALHKNPKDDLARNLLARTLFRLGDYQGAVTQLRALAAAHPSDQEIWYLLGKSYLQLSEASLAKVSQIDPNSALSKEIAGEIMQSMGNSEGALSAYKQAVQLAPDQPGTHEHLADQYWLMGQWPSAREQFQDELKNDPTNCDARWKSANSLLAMHGDPAEALKELDQAIALCPTLMQARVDRARAYLRLGKPEQAVKDLTLAEEHSPDEPYIHFFLAQAYRAEGRSSEAHSEIQTYEHLKQTAMETEAQKAAEEESNLKDEH